MPRNSALGLCVFVALFGWSALASAQGKAFVPLPQLLAGSPRELELRFVEYAGTTNGEMVVEVRNTSTKSAKFRAEGLYFVPDGDPARAPQRLGAAGPFTEIERGRKGAHRQETSVAPGETKRLHLEVFCIDSHRGSPNPSTKFSLAKSRMPADLRRDIAGEAATIIRSNAGDVAKSKAAIQSATWKHRDKKWLRLEGERSNEKSTDFPMLRRNRDRD